MEHSEHVKKSDQERATVTTESQTTSGGFQISVRNIASPRESLLNVRKGDHVASAVDHHVVQIVIPAENSGESPRNIPELLATDMPDNSGSVETETGSSAVPLETEAKSVETDATPATPRSSRGRPDRKVIDALASHMAAHPEICDKLRPTRYRSKHIASSSSKDKGQELNSDTSSSGEPGVHTGLNQSTPTHSTDGSVEGEEKKVLYREGTLATIVESSTEYAPQEVHSDCVEGTSANKNPSSDVADNSEELKLVVNLTAVMNGTGEDQEEGVDTGSQSEPPVDNITNQDVAAEVELYHLASAFADRPAFRIERDVLPAREPTFLREFDKGRHRLVHGRPRSDVFPSDCRNMFTFRQFIDRQATKMADVLSPDQLRARKLRRLGEKVKFPELIQSRKTTSAIFRDFRSYREKEMARNPHARSTDTTLRSTAVTRPKSPMTRLRERVMLMRRAQTAL